MPGIKFLSVPGKPNAAWVSKDENNYRKIKWTPGPTPGAGFERVDAAIYIGDDTVFFSGDRLAIVHIDRVNYNDTLKDGPKPLGNWNSFKKIGFTSVDAILAVPDRPDQYFVFSGNECARLNRNPAEAIYGRVSILDRWATLPFITVDTTLPHPTDSSDAYFFTGSTYVRVTIALGSNQGKIHHEPHDTPHFWPCLWQSGSLTFPTCCCRLNLWDGEKGFFHIPPPPFLRLHTVWRTASGHHVEGDVLELHKFLGAKDGELYWGGKNFQEYARAIEVTGNISKTDENVPHVALHVRFDHETVGRGRTASIDLTGMLELQADNKLMLSFSRAQVAAIIPAEIAVRTQHLDEIGRKMGEYLENNAKDLKVVKVSSKTEESSDGFKAETLYVYSYAGPKATIKIYTAQAQATVTHLTDKHFKGDFLSVEADAHAGPKGAFGVYGAKVEYGPLEVDGGLAVEVGAGIKDDSLNVEAGVFDITIGRKFGIHVLGAGFSIDFGKCTIM
ncbi:hypothetical protein FRC10_010749 [Ceratobasidium sp. 414]|nr:hypothetical protein FRC10_010749 [Ceratobasidium sp. 414]